MLTSFQLQTVDMPQRRGGALPPSPADFFPGDPSLVAADLTLPVPPIEFTQGDHNRGDPGPSSLAHRLSVASAVPLEPQQPPPHPRKLDLRVNDVGPSTSTSTGKRRRKGAAEVAAPGATSRSQPAGLGRAKSTTTNSTAEGKGEGKAFHGSTTKARPERQRTSSTSRDIRVHPSSSSDAGESEEIEAEDLRPKKRRHAPSVAESDDDASDAYIDDGDEETISSSSDDDASETEGGRGGATESSDFDPRDRVPPAVRRKPSRRRRDSPDRGGPEYEGFASSVPALKSMKVPPLVPSVLRGSDNLKALLLASFDGDDEEEGEATRGMDRVSAHLGGGGSGDVASGRARRGESTDRKLTAAQLAELERASDP